MKINTLEQDHQYTNASNEFRQKNGLAKARNPYSWWKYAIAAISVNPNGVTFPEILKQLAAIGVKNIHQTAGGQLSKMANQEERDPVARNYSINLPGISKMLGLVKAGTKDTFGRPAIIYKFKDCSFASLAIEKSLPEMMPLINLLNRKRICAKYSVFFNPVTVANQIPVETQNENQNS